MFLLRAASGDPAAHFLFIRADAPIVENLLGDSIGANGFDGAVQFEHIGREILFEIFLGAVPGAIGTDHNAFFISFWRGLTMK